MNADSLCIALAGGAAACFLASRIITAATEHVIAAISQWKDDR